MEPLQLDDDDTPPHPVLRRLLTFAIGAGLLAGGVLAMRSFLAHPVDKGPLIHQISLVNQPPPPPKPPEKPPEPPKTQDEVKVDTPQQAPKPDEAKPAEPPAGLTSALKGEGGPDFGARYSEKGSALGEVGGRGSRLGAYYTGLLQRQFYEALSRNRKMLHDDFRVVVKIWIDDEGQVTRADIVNGSGDPEVDEQVHATLMAMAPLKEVPPAYMRPIEIRLSNRS